VAKAPAPVKGSLLDQIEEVALHQRFPVEAVRAVQEDLVVPRGTAGALAGTDEDVHKRCPLHAVRMADHHRRVRSGFAEVAGPNLPGLHSASTFKVDALAVRRSAWFSSRE
jgi:hypothetical protein